jgi:hypothetical protein
MVLGKFSIIFNSHTQSNRLYYITAPVSTGNTFQDLPRLREPADNNERYI